MWMKYNFAPAGLRGRVILGKGDDMDELISKRAVIEAIEKARANVGHNLERSIGKSIIEILDDVGRDIDRLPSALGTNLAEVGTELISRQSAIDAIRDMQAFEDDNGQPYLYLYDVMAVFTDEEELPTIQPEPHWIPVAENCDCDLMDNEEVLVFQKDGTINGQIRHAMFYDFNGKKKFVTWEEGITIYDVVAYMPLPEPYKGVTE